MLDPNGIVHYTNAGIDHELRRRMAESSMQIAADMAVIQNILVKKKLTTVKEIEKMRASILAEMDRMAEDIKGDAYTET